ncbi:MAG TPA: hypothetical protein VGN59_16765 [Acidimicrobiia bacterium]|jgi:hypothetical protein
MAGKEAQAVNTPAAARVCSRCSRALAGDDGTCPSCAERAAEPPRRDAPATDESTEPRPAPSPPATADDHAPPAADEDGLPPRGVDDDRLQPRVVPVGMRAPAHGIPRRAVVAILIIALAIFMGVLIANSISRTSKAERHFNTCVASPNIPECNN